MLLKCRKHFERRIQFKRLHKETMTCATDTLDVKRERWEGRGDQVVNQTRLLSSASVISSREWQNLLVRHLRDTNYEGKEEGIFFARYTLTTLTLP